MAEKAYVITDLGPGDGGKGGVVEAVTEKVHARVVIKEGGAQGSHGVVLSDGRKFNFSQWGCGTFQGVPTYISSRFVMSPIGLLNEADALGKVGITNAFELLSADPDCVCATPYHQVWSQLYEISLKDRPHGTVGTGVGKAWQLAMVEPELTIRSEMLTDRDKVRNILEKQRNFVCDLYGHLTRDDVLPQDIPYLTRNLSALANDFAVDDIADRICLAGWNLHLQEMRDVVRPAGNIVVERSHGVLTDSETGFKPHVSSLRTLPIFTRRLLAYHGFSGKVVNLGVHRAYEIRHGAGPMPTEDAALRESLLPHSHKDSNRWQGDVRVGALDLMLLAHALGACGGSIEFDGICLTWFDQILLNGVWNVCSAYSINRNVILPFTKLDTRMLGLAKPLLTQFGLPTRENNSNLLLDTCKDVFESTLNLPVKLISFGPHREDKQFL